MSLFIILPDVVLKLIQEHLKASIIQHTFKLNRPMTKFECGDRIMILKKKIYGTIIRTYDKYSKITLLPQIIPHWKKYNINYWNSFKDNMFPYYIPISIKESNNKIVKLNNWNFNINYINRLQRLQTLDLNKSNNITYKKSNMFTYYF